MILLVFAGLAGAIITAGTLAFKDWQMALALAPIGGSLAALMAAGLLCRSRRRPVLRVSVSLIPETRS